MLAALIASVGLTACGGGASGDSASPEADAPRAPITVSAVTAPPVSAADCGRLMSEAASIAAVDLTDPNIKAVADFVQRIDPDHAYKVFVRRPADFVNWIAGSGGTVNLQTLGVATRETLHMTDNVLRGCAPLGVNKILFHGTIQTTLMAAETTTIQIIDAVIPAALKAEPRYATYITGAAAGNDFNVLMDLFAAYVGAAHTDMKMIAAGETKGMTGTLDSNLGATVNFMVYLQYYLQAARVSHPLTQANIRNDTGTVQTIQAVWNRAEQVLRDSYPYTLAGSTPRLTVNNAYLSEAYSAGPLSELDQIGVTHATRASWAATYLP